jgi:hypothetical protein
MLAGGFVRYLLTTAPSARKSRGTDYWDNDDYDVRLGDASGADGAAVVLDDNRAGAPPSFYNHGYAVSREQAMQYFKARWVASIN